jgi:hypothetical protein
MDRDSRIFPLCLPGTTLHFMPSATRPGPLRCPELPSPPGRRAAGGARSQVPEENLSSPRAEKPGSGRQEGRRGGRTDSRQEPLGSQTRVLEEAAKNTHPLDLRLHPRGDSLGAGSPKLAPSSPSASEALAGSRVPG